MMCIDLTLCAFSLSLSLSLCFVALMPKICRSKSQRSHSKSCLSVSLSHDSPLADDCHILHTYLVSCFKFKGDQRRKHIENIFFDILLANGNGRRSANKHAPLKIYTYHANHFKRIAVGILII